MDRPDPGNQEARQGRSRLCGAALVVLLGVALCGAIGGSILFGDDLREVDGFVVSDGLWAQGHSDPPHLGGQMFMEKTNLTQLLSSDAPGSVRFVPTADGGIYPRPSAVREGANPVRVVGCPWGVLAMEQDRAVLCIVPSQGRIDLTDFRPGAGAIDGGRVLPNGQPGGGPPADGEQLDSLLSKPGLVVAFHPGTLREYRTAKRRLGWPRPRDLVYLARPPGGQDDLAVLWHAAWTLGGKERLRAVTGDKDLAGRAAKAGFVVELGPGVD